MIIKFDKITCTFSSNKNISTIVIKEINISDYKPIEINENRIKFKYPIFSFGSSHKAFNRMSGGEFEIKKIEDEFVLTLSYYQNYIVYLIYFVITLISAIVADIIYIIFPIFIIVMMIINIIVTKFIIAPNLMKRIIQSIENNS